MFLDVEWAGIEVEHDPKDLELLLWDYLGPANTQRIRHELYNVRPNGNRRIPQ